MAGKFKIHENQEFNCHNFYNVCCSYHFEKMIFNSLGSLKILLDVRTMTGSRVKLDSPKLLIDITSIRYSIPGSRSLIIAFWVFAGYTSQYLGISWSNLLGFVGEY